MVTQKILVLLFQVRILVGLQATHSRGVWLFSLYQLMANKKKRSQAITAQLRHTTQKNQTYKEKTKKNIIMDKFFALFI